jgi:hypothetical protein
MTGWIGSVLFAALFMAVVIIIIWLRQNGPGRTMVRVLFWAANQMAAVAKGADWYVAGYHEHWDTGRLRPAYLGNEDYLRKLCEIPTR